MRLVAVLFVFAGAVFPLHAAGDETTAAVHQSYYYAAESFEDPRRRETGEAERSLQKLGDAVFSRPIYIARFLTGVAVLPVALPIAVVFTSWRDAIEICVSGPYAMALTRPLGD